MKDARAMANEVGMGMEVRITLHQRAGAQLAEGAGRRGGGGVRCDLFVCIYGLNSHLKYSFKSIFEKKHQKVSMWGLSFVCRT